MHRRTVITAGPLALLTWSEASAQQQPLNSDGATRHRDFARASELLNQRRWSQLSSLVETLPPQSARKLIGDLGEIAPLDLDAEGLDQLQFGNTILAGFHVEWAWRFRGSGVASTITPSGLRGFTEHLNLGKARVEQAIQADPNDGIARAFGFSISKGLSDRQGLRDGLRGFLMARRRPVGGFAEYANAMSRKWLGSETQALGFARDTFMLDLPASTGLIPDTHYTEWGARVMASARSTEPPITFEAYLAQSPVREDILRANDAFNLVSLDPDPYANLYAACNFSYVLLAMNEVDLARSHLMAQGHYVGGPWTNLPDPDSALTSIRHRLGLETL